MRAFCPFNSIRTPGLPKKGTMRCWVVGGLLPQQGCRLAGRGQPCHTQDDCSESCKPVPAKNHCFLSIGWSLPAEI